MSTDDQAGGETAGGPEVEPRRPPVEREVSAGGVALRGDDVMVVVPHRRAADGRKVLALPKGHIDGDESAEEAAQREVREEAGIETDLVGELGDVRYWYQRGGRRISKVVHFFLFRYVSGDPADHDHEIEEARWIPLQEARTALTYRGEREMVERALSRSQAAR
jgi:8-oxo-dGTP pyrophosphatase MutT (NUDIX family)